MPWDEVMDKFRAGKLKSGGSGKKVTNPKQAVAIEYSEKRQAQAGKKEYQSKGKKKKKGHKGKKHRRQKHHSPNFKNTVDQQLHALEGSTLEPLTQSQSNYSEFNDPEITDIPG